MDSHEDGSPSRRNCLPFELQEHLRHLNLVSAGSGGGGLSQAHLFTAAAEDAAVAAAAAHYWLSPPIPHHPHPRHPQRHHQHQQQHPHNYSTPLSPSSAAAGASPSRLSDTPLPSAIPRAPPSSPPSSSSSHSSSPSSPSSSSSPAPQPPPPTLQTIPSDVVALIAEFLPARERFAVATLRGLTRVQAQALALLDAASMDNASLRGLVELLEFRRRHHHLCQHLLRDQHQSDRDGDVRDEGQQGRFCLLRESAETATAHRAPYLAPLRYSSAAMDLASWAGHVHVLEWWKTSGLELKYSTLSMDNADWNGHAHVLQWWKDSGLELRWSSWATTGSSLNGHVHVLEWWRTSGLKWWRTSGLRLSWTRRAMEWASENGHVHALQWWRDSGLELKWSEWVVRNARLAGRSDVLAWWRDSGLIVSDPADAWRSGIRIGARGELVALADPLQSLWGREEVAA
ncbi:hypothetical protein DFJ73DRAFT_802997 [Zopfochytrium polystomum]|nr:hypothetical protein DFJ73DRAFT_802997 [Zopfochytrium polystomum]